MNSQLITPNGKLTPSQTYIQTLLDENEQLLKRLKGLQNPITIQDMMHFLRLLHRNLVYLAVFCNYKKYLDSLPLPFGLTPIPEHPPVFDYEVSSQLTSDQHSLNTHSGPQHGHQQAQSQNRYMPSGTYQQTRQTCPSTQPPNYAAAVQSTHVQSSNSGSATLQNTTGRTYSSENSGIYQLPSYNTILNVPTQNYPIQQNYLSQQGYAPSKSNQQPPPYGTFLTLPPGYAGSAYANQPNTNTIHYGLPNNKPTSANVATAIKPATVPYSYSQNPQLPNTGSSYSSVHQLNQFYPGAPYPSPAYTSQPQLGTISHSYQHARSVPTLHNSNSQTNQFGRNYSSNQS